MRNKEELIKVAQEALKNSYSPYSHLRVGAAVLSNDGRIFSGTNIENASYGLTVCAERVALFKAISEGARRITAVAVVSDTLLSVYHVEHAGKVIWEFAENTEVIMCSAKGEIKVKKIQELLPQGFVLKEKD